MIEALQELLIHALENDLHGAITDNARDVLEKYRTKQETELFDVDEYTRSTETI